MTFIIYIIVLMDNFANILRKHKLRPTKQRVSLGSILFGKGDRHITAEILKKESDEEVSSPRLILIMIKHGMIQMLSIIIIFLTMKILN